MLRLLMTVALLLWALPAAAQELWQGLRAGMSEAEARAKIPGVARPAEPGTLSSGASCTLHLPGYEVASDRFRVCLYFLDGGLVQVTLSAEAAPSRPMFDNLVDLLTARYGRPLSVRRSSLGWEADWALDSGVNVGVIYFDKLSPLLNIFYQTRMATEAGKL